ncbi:MAG: 1-acyl-sn-glycerol-3-phosphate acyltransferase [Mycoplasmatales bacterium]|nr:1-acyl-sn-glycerol-3-phosphate acyltransferase [Mycoplasmatales bacterium]
MNIKLKLLLNYPRIAMWNRKSKKIGKKFQKYQDIEKYPAQWRNNWVLKRVKKFLKILGVELEVIGFDNLPKAPAILIPNHSSSMDPAIILLALENPNPGSDFLNWMPIFLAKTELKKHKKISGYAKMIETIFIDRNKPREALKAMDELTKLSKEQKKFQVIFPEGTRSKDGNIAEFKSGAFRSAKKGFLPIVPVTINNSALISNFERKEKIKVKVIFHPQIKPLSFMTQENKGIANNVRKIVMKSYVKPKGKIDLKNESKA